MHDKVSILISKGIETVYSFETEKGRKNVGWGSNLSIQKRKKKMRGKMGRMNKDKK